ncbi:Teichoic acids export ATP-binding protein TagH [compost metagenome]
MATIQISNVWKRFQLQSTRAATLKEALVRRLRGSERGGDAGGFWALQDVSFDIERGETFGIIGSNGSGKSTLLKLITGISKPTRGGVGVSGRLSALLELGAGFHPDFSGRENIYLNGAILGLSRQEIRRHFDSIVAFAELERFIDNPVKTYSSGMYMRLAFSIAIHVDPEILVVDEVLAVGDSAFQQKCYDQIHRFKHQGRTIVFVSHSLSTVQDLCQRSAWLDKGVLRALGNTHNVLDFYSQQIAEAVEKNKQDFEVLVPDGRAQIQGIRVLDDHGADRNILDGSGGARFEFALASSLRCDELDILARIFRADGICCYDQRVRLSDFADGSAAGRITFALPDLRLHSGSYFLQLNAALAGEDAWLDEKFFNFAVESPRRGYGIAPFEATWSRISEDALHGTRA